MTDHTKVGEILPSSQPRDAIHIAVAAVVATEKLFPGQNIGFVEGAEHDHKTDVAACERAMSVGIVDPFLTDAVLPGQWFWMFLHPYTITSLRHNWTHPAFGSDHQEEVEKAASEKWMANFANGYGVSYRDMLDAGTRFLSHGDYFCDGGTFEGEHVPDEYWDHYENITGRKVKSDDRESFFTCSC